MQQEFIPQADRAESPGEFLDRLRRSGQARRALANPMRGAWDAGVELFDVTAESLPAVMGSPFDRGEGLIPRKVDIGPVSLGMGPLYKPEIGIGDTQIPLPGIGLPAVPEMPFLGRTRPESTEAFRDFIQQTPVSPAPGLPPEPMNLSQASAEVRDVFRDRPIGEQLALGLADPIGTGLTGGLGVTKGVRAGAGLARQIPDLFSPGPVIRETMDFAIPRPAANRFWTGMQELPPGRRQSVEPPLSSIDPPPMFTEPVPASVPASFEPSRVIGTTTETVLSPAERTAMQAIEGIKGIPEQVRQIPGRIRSLLDDPQRALPEGPTVRELGPGETPRALPRGTTIEAPAGRIPLPETTMTGTGVRPTGRVVSQLWNEPEYERLRRVGEVPEVPTTTTPLWRGEPVPQGPTSRWTQEVGPTGSRLWNEPTVSKLDELDNAISGRVGADELFEVGRPTVRTDATGRFMNKLWRDESPAVRQAGERLALGTGRAADEMQQVLELGPGRVDDSPIPLGPGSAPEDAARQFGPGDEGYKVQRTGSEEPGWFKGGIDPSDVDLQMPGFKSRVASGTGRLLGKAIEKIWGGPGFQFTTRQSEIDGAWVQRFGSKEDEAASFALIDLLKNVRSVSRQKVEVQQVEVGKRVGAGLGAAADVKGPMGAKMAAYVGKQGGELTSAANLDAAQILDELGEDGINYMLDVMGRAGPIGSPPLPAGARPPEQILLPWDHYNAYMALNDLLTKGVVPQPRNIELIQRVFGPGVGEQLVKRRPRTIPGTGYTVPELIGDIINIPRASLSSVDLSMIGRQGGILLPRFPKISSAAAKLAGEAIAPGGEEVAQGVMTAMREVNGGQTWNTYVNVGGLFIHDLGPGVGRLLGREEAFMSSLAGKFLPWVRPSERAYALYLSKLRWDVMDDFVRRFEAARGSKLDMENADDIQFVQDLAKFLNSATGRGPLPGEGRVAVGGGDAARGIATLMNALLFSPRLASSRISTPVYAAKNIIRPLVGIYPEAVKGDEAARNAYKDMSWLTAQSIASFVGVAATINLLVKAGETAGLPMEASVDPKSSDFGKGRLGNSRYDVWTGYTQFGRAIYQTAKGLVGNGQTRSAQTDELRPTGATDVLGQFARSKFMPSLGMAIEYNLTGLTGDKWGIGTGFFGEDRNILEDMGKMPLTFIRGVPTIDEESFWTRFLAPLLIRDISNALEEELRPLIPESISGIAPQIDTSKEQPNLFKAVGLAIPPTAAATFGIGVTTFRTKNDIAYEITKDQPGGAKDYIRMQPFEQDLVDDIAKAREAERGVSRTQGLGATLDEIDAREVAFYEDLERRASTMTIREVNNEYYAGKEQFRVEKDRELYAEFGPRSEEFKEMNRSQMGPAELMVQEFYDALDSAKEVKLGVPLTSDEYSSILDAWETKMVSPITPVSKAALFMVRMNTHRTEIPEGVLIRLSPKTRARYKAARKLRDQYREGELDKHLYVN